MLDGIHKIYNIHAIKRLLKPAFMPNVQLAIGEGESLASVNDSVKYPIRQKSVIQPELATQSYELSQIDGFADPLKVEDFPKDLYYGEAVPPIGGA